ncbi:MAG: ribonuclease Z [Chloroflexi bacterium]|nr:MAG: ribonuclease Z [Chloroflexota bacterium]
MKLAFLGTGAAFSLERYNGSVCVDGRLLLDAGAPLLTHLHRLGIDPGGIETIFLTHFHADHTLGLAPFVLHRLFRDKRPFTIVGPTGVEERMEAFFRFAWHDDFWLEFRARLPLTYVEAGESGELNGIRYETVALKHGAGGCTGYRLWIDGRLLAYSGDTEPTPELEQLVEGAEIAIIEATGPGDQFSHMPWDAALALRDRHPKTRYFFNHIYEGTLENATEDLTVVEV